MIKKMMSYVFGIVFVAVAFVAVLATVPQQKVYSESVEDPLAISLTGEIIDAQHVQISANIQQNTGLYDLQFNLDIDTHYFNVTMKNSNDFGDLAYFFDTRNGLLIWSADETSKQNETKTGKIITFNLELREDTCYDGTYSFEIVDTVARYIDGSDVLVNKKTVIQSSKIIVKNKEVVGVLVGEDAGNGFPNWTIIFIASVGGAIIGGIITLIVVKSKKKPKKSQQKRKIFIKK